MARGQLCSPGRSPYTICCCCCCCCCCCYYCFVLGARQRVQQVVHVPRHQRRGGGRVVRHDPTGNAESRVCEEPNDLALGVSSRRNCRHCRDCWFHLCASRLAYDCMTPHSVMSVCRILAAPGGRPTPVFPLSAGELRGGGAQQRVLLGLRRGTPVLSPESQL